MDFADKSTETRLDPTIMKGAICGVILLMTVTSSRAGFRLG